MPDGSFQSVSIEATELQDLFADKVLSALLDESLLTQDDIDNMNSWQHSGFNVFVGEPIDWEDQKRLLFAARYLKKCPLSNERLKIVEPAGEDSYIEYASFKNREKSVRTFTPLELLAEISQHIPDIWEQTSRFFGAYSARTRGALKEKKSAESAILPLPEPTQKPSTNWARLMKKIFEFDPLICPKCGSTMKIKAFITDLKEIVRITKNLGIQEQRAPPKLKYVPPLAA
jgi:hypothetical protein